MLWMVVGRGQSIGINNSKKVLRACSRYYYASCSSFFIVEIPVNLFKNGNFLQISDINNMKTKLPITIIVRIIETDW